MKHPLRLPVDLHGRALVADLEMRVADLERQYTVLGVEYGRLRKVVQRLEANARRQR